MHRMTTGTVVIGAGQAGLAAAHHLSRTGQDALVLDASAGPGGSWPHYYDSLTLFSPARFSELPGLHFRGNPERYPHRDEVTDYLTRYALRLNVDIRYGHRVVAVEPVADGFRCTGTDFDVQARNVVVASGSFGNPFLPSLPGIDSFTGTVLHAVDYRTPSAFAGARVAVVGAGNSAVQIAAELTVDADVSVYSRKAIRWQRQRILGQDLHWWLTRTGLDGARIPRGLLPATTPVVDDGRYRSVFRDGTAQWRPMFARVEGSDLVAADGTRHPTDVLLFATGYRPHVPFLEHTVALDPRGVPLHRGGLSTSVRGLGFVGLEHQRTFASATLRGVGRDAAAIISRL